MRIGSAVMILGVALLSACETARATAYSTPKERVAECEQTCTSVGMRFSALVVMMNSAGCVCEPKTEPAVSTVKAGTGLAAGGSTIAAAAAAAMQAQQQQAAQAAQMAAHPPPPAIHH